MSRFTMIAEMKATGSKTAVELVRQVGKVIKANTAAKIPAVWGSMSNTKNPKLKIVKMMKHQKKHTMSGITGRVRLKALAVETSYSYSDIPDSVRRYEFTDRQCQLATSAVIYIIP